MKIYNNRLSVIVATLILTIALLGSSQYYWHQYSVYKPLSERLQTIEGLESFEVNDKNKKLEVNATLNNITDLSVTYHAISSSITEITGSTSAAIVIKDHRTPELEQFYHSIHYYIQEAVVTGNFGSMAERIENKASSAGIISRVSVDSQYIYIQMTKDNNSMYLVVSRNTQPEVK